jgi:DNA-directed RNA polymerase subunit L
MSAELEFKDVEFSKKDQAMHFKICNMRTSVLNALRRTILGEIRNVGFLHGEDTTIKIVKNSTGLHNECLSHRISMLALKSREFSREAVKSMHFEGKKNLDSQCELKKYKFMLNVSQKTHTWVSTDDFQVYKEDVLLFSEKSPFFPFDGYSKSPTLITRFPIEVTGKEPEELIVECYPTIMSGRESAGFSPVSISAMYPLPDGKNGEKCNQCVVEGVGSMPPAEIVMLGIKTLKSKLDKCLKEFENIQLNVDTPEDRSPDMDFKINTKPIDNPNYQGIEYLIKEESHTLGNMLQDWIYLHEILNKDSRLEHISYFEPHPLSNSIIIRVMLKNTTENTKNTDTYKMYSARVNNIMVGHLNTLYDYFMTMEKKYQIFRADF